MNRSALAVIAGLALLLTLQGCSGARRTDRVREFLARPEEHLSIWAHSDIQPRNPRERRHYKEAIRDMSRMGEIDLAIVAGDMVHDPRSEEAFRWYLHQREVSGIPHWYEIAGNHEAKHLPAYFKYLDHRLHHSVEVGNVLVLLMSNEARGRRTRISEQTFRWWREQVIRNQGKILITVTHACPEQSGLLAAAWTDLTMEDADCFGEVLANHRVDLWLCGHSHLPGYLPRKERAVPELNGTLFIDVSAIRRDPLSDTESRVLVFRSGSNELLVRSRNHHVQRYIEHRDILHSLAHEFWWDGTPPRVRVP